MNRNNNSNRKRRSKNKKWKRTKLLQPKPDKSQSFSPSRLQNITPSKCEHEIDNTIVEAETEEIMISDGENDISCVLNESSRFDFSSDEENSYLHNSVIEEFVTNGHNSEASVVSAQVNYVSTDDDSTVSYVKIKRKNEQSAVSPVKKKLKLQTSEIHLKNVVFSKEVQCYYRNDGIIVILEKNDTVYFHGLCILSVLHGQIEVLGHVLTKNSAEAKLYSPRGSSLLYLKNTTESNIPVTDYLLSLQVSNKIRLTTNSAILFCKKLQEFNINFIEKHISQQILPKQNQNFPRIVFQPTGGNWNLLKINQNWSSLVETIENTTKLMICGGKGVGKTTFLRYAINKLLMKFNEIQIIDLDPGQSEFTVPGCISIVKINKPIFGPNYTHLHPTEKSLLSNINISYDPEKYITTVKELIKTNLDEIPTLINYMGYTHGLGLNILSAVITSIQPTDVLQICSEDSKKNYKFLLEKNVVAENANLFVSVDPDLCYNLHQIESMCDQNDYWTAEARVLRETCVLSFMSQMVDLTIFKSKMPMYRINFNDVNISDLNGEKIHPAAVNACFVALCKLENEDKQVFQCFSWGIVRGIDLVSNELVLLTCENLETLNKVTHLIANGVTLPPSVYMTSEELTCSMPYVNEGSLISFAQIPKRSRISVKNAK